MILLQSQERAAKNREGNLDYVRAKARATVLKHEIVLHRQKDYREALGEYIEQVRPHLSAVCLAFGRSLLQEESFPSGAADKPLRDTYWLEMFLAPSHRVLQRMLPLHL
jgi:hypothetical protein